MEMNLNRLFSLLLTKLKYIILIAIIAAVASFGYTKAFVDERYTSSAKFLVEMETGQNKTTELTFTQSALNSYMAIFNTRDFFNDVADIYKIEYPDAPITSSEIRGMTSIAASSKAEDPTFNITVTSLNQDTAYNVAKTISSYAKQKIESMPSLNPISMIETPVPPISPSSPNVKKNTLLGFALGLILTAAFFVCREMFDGRIKNIEDISNQYDLPILGVIPDSATETAANSKKSKGSKHYAQYGKENK